MDIITGRKHLNEVEIYQNYMLVKKKSIMMVGSYIFVHGGISLDLADKYSIGEINNIVAKWMLKKKIKQKIKYLMKYLEMMMTCLHFGVEYLEKMMIENTERNFNRLLETINRKNKLVQPAKGMVIAHTPQFMDGKYLNAIYNDRLWRIDVGMSRAFGEHRDCGDDKYRQPQILIIHNDNRFEVRKTIEFR